MDRPGADLPRRLRAERAEVEQGELPQRHRLGHGLNLMGIPWTDVSDENKISCDQPRLDAPIDEFSVQGRAN